MPEGMMGRGTTEDQGTAPGMMGQMRMAVSPADFDVVNGAYRGLQRSLDGGHEWRRNGPAPEGLVALAASGTASLYAAT